MTSDDIHNQRELLATNRRTLAYLVEQAAVHGGEVLVPPQIRSGIDHARSEIQRIKDSLRAQSVAVTDEFNDAPTPPTPPTPPANTSRGTQRRFLIIAIIGGPLAILTGIVSNAIALPEQLRPYALPLLFVLAVAGIGIGVWQWRVEASGTTHDARQAQRNRDAMLQKVRQTWIDGVLRQSLYDEVRLDLGMRTNPAGIEQPWRGLVQELDGTPETLPTGTHASAVFDRFHGTLLILGAPGGGKTTLLLELTNTLLDRAQRNPLHPIPVVFPLSTWAARPRPITQWLREELRVRYQVPRAIAQTWLDTDQVLPLLDGLDEVAAPQRAACVTAINTFRHEHGLLPLVVSSRVTEYNQLSNDETRLQLDGAIILEALTRAEVQKYLADVAPALDGVRAALDADQRHWLWKFAINPLMLSIIALVYRGTAAATLQVAATPELQQRQLFDAYTKAMFTRHAKSQRYSMEKTELWLSQLAARLVQRNHTIFLIENLQPEWLYKKKQRRYYWLLDRGLGIMICGVCFGLPVAFCSVLLYKFEVGLLNGVAAAIVYGLVFGMIIGAYGGQSDPYFQDSRTLKSQIFDTIIGIIMGVLISAAVGGFIGALGGGIIGLANGKLAAVILYAIILGLLYALACGIPGGLFGGFLSGFIGRPRLGFRNITTIEALKFSIPRTFPSILKGLIGGVFYTSPFAIVVGASIWVGINLREGVMALVIILLFGVLVGGVIGALIGAFRSEELTNKSRPNQGVHRSLRNSMTISLTFLLTITVICSVFTYNRFSQVEDMYNSIGITINALSALPFSLGLSLLVASFVSLPLAFAYGGYAVCSHLALRLVLWRARVLPWNVARFLDYGVERIFLRRVGGGYIFVHRTVMEYFAQMALTPAQPATPLPRTGAGPGVRADTP